MTRIDIELNFWHEPAYELTDDATEGLQVFEIGKDLWEFVLNSTVDNSTILCIRQCDREALKLFLVENYSGGQWRVVKEPEEGDE